MTPGLLSKAVKTTVSSGLGQNGVEAVCLGLSWADTWHTWVTHERKMSGSQRRPRPSFVVSPAVHLMGPWPLPPSPCCAVRISLRDPSAVLPYDFCYCPWNKDLVPSGFHQYPAVTEEDSRGRDWVRERGRLSLGCGWPEPARGERHVGGADPHSGLSIPPDFRRTQAGSVSRWRAGCRVGGRDPPPKWLYMWITGGAFQSEFPGLHAKLRQVLGGKGQVLSINLKVTSS